MHEEITIKKDFLNLMKGDIITISTDNDRRIYFNVENRTRKVRFYGNKKGRWSKENPYSKAQKRGESEFMLIDEAITYKTVIEFGYIPFPEPHPTEKCKFAVDSKTTEDWIVKIINDLKLVGVV